MVPPTVAPGKTSKTTTKPPEKDWGDDDSSEEGVYIFEGPADPSLAPVKVYPVSYVYHRSTRAHTLYDVHGFPLQDENGRNYNVWNRDFGDALSEKRVYATKVPGRPSYSFFCTSKKQKEEFLKTRDLGYAPYRANFHVYSDEPGLVIKAKASQRIFRDADSSSPKHWKH
jgi:hypothetical protein